MKRIMKMCLALTMACAMLFCMAACGGAGAAEETLESYFEKNEDQKEQFLSTLAVENDMMTVTGEVKENTIIVTSQLNETQDQELIDLMLPSLDEQVNELQEPYDKAKAEIAEKIDLDLEKIKIVLIFNNGDGSEIWKHEF